MGRRPIGVTVWTSLNMGDGSGLDADALDGFHAADIFAAISTGGSELADEAAARIASDADLHNSLAQESAARIAADADLLNSISEEAEARRASDNLLHGGIVEVDERTTAIEAVVSDGNVHANRITGDGSGLANLPDQITFEASPYNIEWQESPRTWGWGRSWVLPEGIRGVIIDYEIEIRGTTTGGAETGAMHCRAGFTNTEAPMNAIGKVRVRGVDNYEFAAGQTICPTGLHNGFPMLELWADSGVDLTLTTLRVVGYVR